MAPVESSKRRRVEDNDEEEIIDVQTASSGFSRDAASKRQRVSLTSSKDAEEDVVSVISDVGDSNVYDTVPADASFHNDDYAAPQDMLSEEDDDNEQPEDLARATQAMQARMGNTRENHAADNAIIEEIQCTNFMCHARLDLRLGPLINFIIGHNGSGKSAALTALQLCLGGRATNTNRGQKLSDFIKHGEDFAVVSVRIKNQGESAYKPQEYGASIVVERHFNRQGVSAFKIKNAQGRIVSTKKSDLEDIMDAFALQLDNPMMCLTQDLAREFLNNSGPKEKYMFFFRGTQLEALDKDYKILGEQLEEIESRLVLLGEDRQAARRAHLDAKGMLQQVDENQGLINKFQKCRRQMAWVQVREQEENLEKIDKQMQQANEKIANAKQAAENTGAEYERAHEAHGELHLSLTELRGTLEPHSVEKADVRAEFDAGARELKTMQVQERQINGSVQVARKQIKQLERDIAAEEQHIRDTNGERHAEQLKELQAAQDEAQQAQQEVFSHSRGFAELDVAKREAEKAAEKAKQQAMQSREALKDCERNVKTLENSRGQWLKAYDDKMRQLLTAIERETRFREKPIGPCGRHIRILKPEWTSIVERSFGQALNAFCVTNFNDQKILIELMRRIGMDSPILIGDKTPLDTSHNEPDPELLTWARILEFDEDIVRNQAIINQGIEQTVLIRDREEAANFMDLRRNGGKPPPKVRQVFAMHDTRRGEGHRFGFTASGGESMSPISRWDRPSRMKTDSEYQIQEEKQHCQTLNDKYKRAEQHQREQETALKEARQAIERHNRGLSRLKLAQEEARDRADKLQDDLEAAAARPDKLNGLQSQLQDSKAELQNAENQFQDAFEEREKINDKQRSLKARLDGIEAQIEEISMKDGKMTIRLEKLAKKRQDALLKKNESIELIKDAESELKMLETRRAAQQQTIEEYTQQASMVSSRVPIDPGMTGTKLDKLMENLEKRIKDSQRLMGGSPEELRRKAAVMQARYASAVDRFKHADNVSQAFKLARRERIERWKKFRRLISNRARMQFAYLLGQRSFRGQLKLRHLEKELDIHVEPDNTRTSDKGRQTRTLSGGEKSFSTICLLLSLWDAMGNPIRCLDEFDVFMDSVNRDVSMRMMIEAARQSVSKQFILISPQSMNQSHLGPDVHIIKMTDPERGQQPLPATFTRQRG